MSDFDAVLERLVADPAFQAAVATDPAGALAGYELDADERQLLAAQMVVGAGGDRTVEVRTSKSGLFGMLGPVAAAFGLAGSGSPSAHEAFGSNSTHEAFGASSGHEAFGTAPAGGSGGTGEAFGGSGTGEAFGDAPDGGTGGGGPEGAFGSASAAEAPDYHTRVDADGDGSWDNYTAYERGDGGVDIAVDADHDGRIDFVGRDYDRDGLVDDADFDNDGDGVLDTRMYDDNGDGWMDRSAPIPR